MDENKILLTAPMQGHTDAAWRHFHSALYGGTDGYLTPFMRVEKGEVRHRDLKELTTFPENSQELTPQIIFRDVMEFEMLADSILSAGYDRIDLNLRCPFPPQVKHGRGAAVINNPKLLQEINEIISSRYREVSFSVKMRLGVTEPDEWHHVIDILNDMSLSHITVHPRVARQQYAGDLDMSQFEEILKASAHPVIYNGDILTVDDIDTVMGRYPELAGVMIGRGLLARPSLAAEYKSGEVWDESRRINGILRLHKALFEYYSANLCGDTQILSKIKPFWEYLEPEIGHKSFKQIKKAMNIDKYLTAVNTIDPKKADKTIGQ